MRYRRLRPDELQALEKEFINFLIINGIDAVDWENLKKSDIVKAEEMLDIFSDMIFDRIVDKVQYIEYFDGKGLKLFKCDDDKIFLVGVDNSTEFKTIDHMLQHLNIHPEAFTIYKTNKAYQPNKKDEIFKMISQGGFVSDGKLYNILSNQLTTKNHQI